MAMHLRNGEHGYGAVTKLLHWLTVVAVVAQFVVGWTMSVDDSARDRFDQRMERLEEQAEAQGEAAEERWDEEEKRLKEARPDSDDGSLDRCTSCSASRSWGWRCCGCSGGARRRCHRGPSYLSPGERTLQHWLEKLLLTMLIVTPGDRAAARGR